MDSGRRQTANELLKQRAKYWPEAITPVSSLMMRLFRFGTLVQENALRQVAAHGLTFTEFEVLITLRSAPPPHELAPTGFYRAVLISSGGLTKVLYALEKRKLVARARAETDGRSKPVRLTDKGRVLAEGVMADVLRTDGDLIYKGLKESEVERLTGLLRKLLSTLEPEGNPSDRLPHPTQDRG